jgi:hypothetical protein
MTLKELDDEQEEQHFNISTLKPEGTEDFKEQAKVNVDSIWTSYANSRKAFSDLGFSLSAYEFEVYGPSGRQLDSNGKGTVNFFAAVDISEEPITQQITTLRRLKAYEYYRNKNGREERRVREYIVYDANLQGVDHWGNPIRARLISQGLSFEPNIRIKVTSDQHGRKQAQYTYDNLRNKYYIPFSAKTVNDLLAKTKTNKDGIRYYCFVGSDPNSHTTKFRCDTYNYEQFTNCTFQELEQLAFKPNQKWRDVAPKKEFVG